MLVQVLTDITTAYWYSDKHGEVGSWVLCQETLRLWRWLKGQGIFLIPNHLAGFLNARANKLSRCRLADHEWRLHPEVAHGIFQQWGES